MAAVEKVLGQIQTSKQLLFLTDFDGTLAPIVERPEMAELPGNTRLLLEKLASKPGVTVGVISGRALSDLKHKVNIAGLIYAGNHGFEIEGPGLKFVSPLADQITPVVRVLRQILTLTLGSLKGVFVEDKGLTLSVHYRQADEVSARAVHQIVERWVRVPLFSGLLKLSHGKKVLELKPAVSWDKGKAIRLLMKRYGRGGRSSGLLPIYLGDDLTDEDGFKMIDKYGLGISIHVGEEPRASLARYFLKSTEEVSFFLTRLLESEPMDIGCKQLSTI
jgi:trehalose 6-phosphate phosphatase